MADTSTRSWTLVHLAYDPATQLVYGVGETPAEALDDAEYQASVVRDGPRPWRELLTRPCTIPQAALVASSNGPARLADVERAAR